MVYFQSSTDQHLLQLSANKYRRGKREVYKKIIQYPLHPPQLSHTKTPHKFSATQHLQLTSDQLTVCYSQYYHAATAYQVPTLGKILR